MTPSDHRLHLALTEADLMVTSFLTSPSPITAVKEKGAANQTTYNWFSNKTEGTTKHALEITHLPTTSVLKLYSANQTELLRYDSTSKTMQVGAETYTTKSGVLFKGTNVVDILSTTFTQISRFIVLRKL